MAHDDAFPLPSGYVGEAVDLAWLAWRDRVERRLATAEEALGWVGARRKAAYRTAVGNDDHRLAFVELVRLAQEDRAKARCWQALENAAEDIGIQTEESTPAGEAKRVVARFLLASE